MTYKFKQNDVVQYDYNGVKGFGFIKGVSTVSLPVIGVMYIVETDVVIDHDIYPYSAIAIPEIHLTLVRNF